MINFEKLKKILESVSEHKHSCDDFTNDFTEQTKEFIEDMCSRIIDRANEVKNHNFIPNVLANIYQNVAMAAARAKYRKGDEIAQKLVDVLDQDLRELMKKHENLIKKEFDKE